MNEYSITTFQFGLNFYSNLYQILFSNSSKKTVQKNKNVQKRRRKNKFLIFKIFYTHQTEIDKSI